MTEPAPIIVSAELAPSEQAWLDDLRRHHFPPERNHLAAHLTMFHHLPPSIAPELAGRLADLARSPPPQATVDGVMNLGRGTALRIHAPALVAIRTELASAFDGMLTPQDAAGWRPHVTIQNKVDAGAARALQASLADLAPRHSRIVALRSWCYRGGPWEAIGRVPFHG